MGYIEIDLHRLTWKEARRTFVETYGDAFDSSGKPTVDQVRVIHGYGSTGEGGAIRNHLRSFCKRFDDYFDFTAGEELDGNLGWTVVTPKRCIPAAAEMLAEDVWGLLQPEAFPQQGNGEVSKTWRSTGHACDQVAGKTGDA